MNIDKKIILEVMQNLCDRNFEELVYYRCKNFVEDLDEIAEDTGYTIDFGLSKIMVDFDEYSDWVIKVPRLDSRMKQNFCELEAKKAGISCVIAKSATVEDLVQTILNCSSQSDGK